jgi:CubicO group peptidase (beta-lactamase class C family)
MGDVRLTRARLAILALTVGPCLVSVDAASEKDPVLSGNALSPIADIAHREIANGRIPGTVVLIGHGREILYRQAFGLRVSRPAPVPMNVDTIFDLASLTKVVATTTAIMQLVERGKLDLDRPVSTYWRRFASAGKQAITIRDLLTHYSGLPADLSLKRRWSGYQTAMKLLAAERPMYGARTQYVYSDENFAVLGELVRRVSGMPLDRYCDEHIFKPLDMKDTAFRPGASQASRIAPTSSSASQGGSVVVHDPTARRMGGVAGHAGLFSTADDLAIFAATLLEGGIFRGARVLTPESVALMTQPASPPAAARVRGLGWDLAPPSTTERVISSGSYGHTGFTGTMIWIDPGSNSYVIILSNRTYPDGRGDAQELRGAILSQVSLYLSRSTSALADPGPVIQVPAPAVDH